MGAETFITARNVFLEAGYDCYLCMEPSNASPKLPTAEDSSTPTIGSNKLAFGDGSSSNEQIVIVAIVLSLLLLIAFSAFFTWRDNRNRKKVEKAIKSTLRRDNSSKNEASDRVSVLEVSVLEVDLNDSAV